ncbi:MAG: hypothetical protein J7K29_04655 [Candidatus Cloacimonetes bacterium]|nr:hypothetical protein [Candidatus Cloacimonadota bacterium]
MTFSEIKPRIKNLGNFDSLKEIKEAGLRICKNTKTGDYWLIEEEFLKPVIKSPRECKSILIKPEDLKYKVFLCNKSKEELEGTGALKYIEWGEEQKTKDGVYWCKVPSVQGRGNWYELSENTNFDLIIPRTINDSYICYYGGICFSDRFYGIKTKNPDNLCLFLNSSIFALLSESLAKQGLGLGALDLNIIEFNKIPVAIDVRNDASNIPKHKEILNIYKELSIDPKNPIRNQQPKPLPDRAELDNIVFDELGLTEQERKEVYWAVAELVKNRLEKARSA